MQEPQQVSRQGPRRRFAKGSGRQGSSGFSLCSTEYRAHIAIPGFPASHDNELGFDLLEWLDEHTEMRPVMSGPGPGDAPATVTPATDAASEATAVAAMTHAVTHALDALGLGHLHPTAEIELEAV